MLALIGKKLDQTQRFLEDGTRIPVTRINVPANVVLDTKTQEKNKYSAIALGYGLNPKNLKKSSLALAKKANLDSSPRLIKEIRLIEEKDLPEIGTVIKVEEVFAPGDVIQVTGMSKGKGFAGGVKRHHFSGGPKTHGQSDRHRAPGSIGQGTTPGRVYKGKKMAGNMGHQNVTVTNLKVISIEGEILLVAGLVPGPANNMLIIKKTGELGKKFIPLTKTQEELDAEAKFAQEEEKRLAKEAEEQAKIQVESAKGTEDLEVVDRETPSDTENNTTLETVEESPVEEAPTPAAEADAESTPVEEAAKAPVEAQAEDTTAETTPVEELQAEVSGEEEKEEKS